MNYQYTVTWTQPYVGWQECKLQELEKRLAYSDLSEAKQVLEKVMSL